jgi:hypothetical protein
LEYLRLLRESARTNSVLSNVLKKAFRML